MSDNQVLESVDPTVSELFEYCFSKFNDYETMVKASNNTIDFNSENSPYHNNLFYVKPDGKLYQVPDEIKNKAIIMYESRFKQNKPELTNSHAIMQEAKRNGYPKYYFFPQV